MTQSSFNRRGFLKGAAAAAAVVPLASCAAGGGSSSSASSAPAGGAKSADNPFGIKEDGKLDAVIFNGGYGISYAQFGAEQMKKKFPKLTTSVKPSNNISQELQPRFVGGNPPDVIDNSGANAIGVSSILSHLDTLDDLLTAKNYEGKTISDTLYPGVKEMGTRGDKFAILNYVMSGYAVWYSDSLFKANGWTVPKTWDEAYKLGEQAKAKGKYLFCWGKEAATYYRTLILGTAYKEGGPEVRLAIENLKPKAWSQPVVQQALTALKKIIDAGFVKPGGAGTQFTAAQAQWSNDQSAILYPSGSWIENEMKSQTKSGFKMTGAPEFVLTDSPKMGYEAMNAAPGEPFIFPKQAVNAGAGKEFMRAMLSDAAATNFAKTILSPTIVKGTVPADGFGSTALVSLTKMLDAAGEKVFNIQWVDYYGVNTEHLVVWNDFLAGKSSVAQITSSMQEISDKVANDSSVQKITIK
ncbi:N-acetylglucosamine/diacetylchitobiose ABC transporter substrate-binding protein [Acidipropionibacterium jensenii]|uniref:N-acetylglucosamine/diacetylchitobiose ABC transporter substrate-binding protein n=1 Tax=Acidipropionibacterium jensenii TaxID=1749 RepID=UPI002649A753|nr:N-acetylglucosamine/diacetylchitobiose ABC transporter substrate-binding protein [Acidipropionibacterium jensenii]MDN5997596.1 N-acetylglucosamine/diacetylchitobiose ABC transporter substrate-binding protein [Acidipropionibacterium jensenii]MDN6427332.1 N-acetylglucosamine/diacetylchitobiose ABC transporter substrate-binding protein [Acidipropionibacterium jensenii]MDN6442450.1 N-acetylglucosamine/diacetylchitobiose ABC transporter substrate-binding protein [Acidipropionibacterium jensenii]M